jgi:hypothetical protein
MTIATRRLARRCRERACQRAMEMEQPTTDPTTLLMPAEPIEDQPPPVVESGRGTAGES